MLLLSLLFPLSASAWWFGGGDGDGEDTAELNEDFRVQAFEFQITCPEKIEILEVQAVQEKTYGILQSGWAVPTLQVVQKPVKALDLVYERSGETIEISCSEGVLKLQEINPDPQFEGAWDGGRLKRADFNLQLLCKDEEGFVHRLSIKALGNLKNDASLKQARRKSLSEFIRERLHGLAIELSRENLMGGKIENALSEEWLRCSYVNGDFMLEELDFKIICPKEITIHGIGIYLQKSYGRKEHGAVTITDVVRKSVPLEMEDYYRGLRIRTKAAKLSLESENPNQNEGGELLRADFEIEILASKTSAEKYLAKVHAFEELDNPSSLKKARSKDLSRRLETHVSGICLNLRPKNIANGGIHNLYSQNYLACDYILSKESQKKMDTFEKLHEETD